MAKVITFISTKGSIDKTILIIHIAGYLASRNPKVLLIDADSQQSLSGYFDYCDVLEWARDGFYDFLAHDKPANVCYVTIVVKS